MFRVGVRDHVMIAHSLRGETFGPAQRLHGATYVVDLELARAELDEDGVVADIGRVSALLHEVLEPLNFRNLDEVTAFDGANTTTEFLARTIFDGVREQIRDGALGSDAGGIHSAKVTLRESHVAWASFEGTIGS